MLGLLAGVILCLLSMILASYLVRLLWLSCADIEHLTSESATHNRMWCQLGSRFGRIWAAFVSLLSTFVAVMMLIYPLGSPVRYALIGLSISLALLSVVIALWAERLKQQMH
ncbi:MAG: hypothetical protein KatS3mg016_1750 [Fimbriimonadales bacterium]|jgi:hypothetical protein|nr:MAG: hypothetical protein KatS3mg016_1750 [Fimbriimonadales bacterium]GIV07811.1 MAG: hypothetical protein KatS3mg017_1013 [Fimbriimonadales bacterium]